MLHIKNNFGSKKLTQDLQKGAMFNRPKLLAEGKMAPILQTAIDSVSQPIKSAFDKYRTAAMNAGVKAAFAVERELKDAPGYLEVTVLPANSRYINISTGQDYFSVVLEMNIMVALNTDVEYWDSGSWQTEFYALANMLGAYFANNFVQGKPFTRGGLSSAAISKMTGYGVISLKAEIEIPY
jgi:hypothetical protein